jgi:hypothetical protein
MITALTMESSTGMPAFFMPITKGDEPAPAPPLVIRESFDGHMTPMTRTPPI